MNRWIVHSEAGEERIEADEVEITPSGALLFYGYASRRQTERSLLLAFAPTSWRRCEAESRE